MNRYKVLVWELSLSGNISTDLVNKWIGIYIALHIKISNTQTTPCDRNEGGLAEIAMLAPT